MTVALHMNETEDTGSLLFLYAPFPAHTKKRHIQRSDTHKEAAHTKKRQPQIMRLPPGSFYSSAGKTRELVLNQLRSRLYNR